MLQAATSSASGSYCSSARACVLAPVFPSNAQRRCLAPSHAAWNRHIQRISVQTMHATGREKHAPVIAVNLKPPPPVPDGYHWYETMLVLHPQLTDEESEKQLARFEAFLSQEECVHVIPIRRGKHMMEYPMRKQWEGDYMLYQYAAKRQTAKKAQQMLSKPEAGAEGHILRHFTKHLGRGSSVEEAQAHWEAYEQSLVARFGADALGAAPGEDGQPGSQEWGAAQNQPWSGPQQGGVALPSQAEWTVPRNQGALDQNSRW